MADHPQDPLPASATTALTPASLGEQIKQRRRASGMTQEVTAALCGISKKTLIRIEKGEDVYFSTLLQVMSALGMGLQVSTKTIFSAMSQTTRPEADDEWF